MRKLNYIFSFLILLSFSGCSIKPAISLQHISDSVFIQDLINNSGGKVMIPKGTYYIDKTILVASGVEINGNNSVFILTSTEESIFACLNIHNTTIRNLTLSGIKGKYSLAAYTHKMEKPLIVVESCKNLTFNQIEFKNHCFTGLKIRNSKLLNVYKCSFNDLGEDYPNGLAGFLYSYDGIYFNCENEGLCEDITIKACEFQNIGSRDFNYMAPQVSTNDGDGIHFQSKNVNKVKNILIENCSFQNCSRRGIKIQAGNKIKIKSNVFKECMSAVGIVTESEISNLQIEDNIFDSCNIAIATNHSFGVSNVEIISNGFTNLNFCIRTSGSSFLDNCKIKDNVANNINTCFFDGIMKNSSFIENKIRNFAVGGDKSYYMALLLALGSENVIIDKNLLSTDFSSISCIYIQEGVRQVTIINNTFELKKSITQDKYVIYSHSNDKKNYFARNIISTSQ
ncbi:MAG: hypothetical protein IT216_12290 [Saprospiraceae bacterium]|nr:hypothetical protein [Saprospiraceae bacterium]